MGHTDGGTHYYDSDVPVYRYADVLLMLAECETGWELRINVLHI